MKRSLTIISLLPAVLLGLLPVSALAQDQLEPGEYFRDCDKCPWMVVVPAGSFKMGSPESDEGRYDNEGPVHEVTIPKPFAVGVFEVTFDEWDACVSAGGCGGYSPHDGDVTVRGKRSWGRGNRPVINVSWEDAERYLDWLSGETGETYRFLSESEWEYVARAGTTGRFHFGNRISASKANYGQKLFMPKPRISELKANSGNKVGTSKPTKPVGSYQPNAFGLYDVHGNVWEWVGDCWNGSYWGAPTNGSVWEAGDCDVAVLRGGSWYDGPQALRSAFRFGGATGHRDLIVGFRVARTLAQ